VFSSFQERSKLETEKPPYVDSITLLNDDLFQWDVTINGPEDTPYAGGKFVLRLEFPAQYPFKPPKLVFRTTVYHPSVQTSTGEVCVAVLGTWGPTLTVQHCLDVVYSLFTDPSPDHPLEQEIAQLLATKPKEFEKMAKKYTAEYAKAP
jgi:ubiquitin-conjugating enzyme E2 D